LILLSFERVVVGLSEDNFIQVLMQALMHQGGFTKYLISIRLMAFGVDED